MSAAMTGGTVMCDEYHKGKALWEIEIEVGPAALLWPGFFWPIRQAARGLYEVLAKRGSQAVMPERGRRGQIAEARPDGCWRR